MSSPSNNPPFNGNEVMFDSSMRALVRWLEAFEHLPHLGNSEVFTECHQWMKAQPSSYWSGKGKEEPQIGDIFCVYLIVVGVCECWTITDAFGLLSQENPPLRYKKQTKAYWMKKLQKHLNIESVMPQYSEEGEPIGVMLSYRKEVSNEELFSELTDEEKINFLCEASGMDLSKVDIANFDVELVKDVGGIPIISPEDYAVVITPKIEKSTPDTLQ